MRRQTETGASERMSAAYEEWAGESGDGVENASLFLRFLDSATRRWSLAALRPLRLNNSRLPPTMAAMRWFIVLLSAAVVAFRSSIIVIGSAVRCHLVVFDVG